MKKPLLEIVRNILTEMDSDDVQSISDTDEALQVATVIRSTYFEMMSNRNWPHLKKLITLDHSGNVNLPTHLKLPDNFKELEFLKYDCTKNGGTDMQMLDMKYLYPDEFLRVCGSRSTDTLNTRLVTDPGGTKIAITTNKQPRYWTSFDDRYLVLDSFDSSIDDTLKASKTQAFVVRFPGFELLDDHVPDLPAEQFSALEEEAKSTAFFVLKQMANEKAEQKAVRQQRWAARKAWQAKGGIRYPDYGRRGRK